MMATTTIAPRRTFFDRMIAKSEEQVRAGNLPRILRSLPQAPNGDLVQVWSVASRQTAGEIHIVEVVQPTDGREVTLRCDCPAEHHCWHQAHVLRALNGEVPFFRTPERPVNVTRQLADVTMPALSTDELFGTRA
jgi:hypothetical protein